MKIYIAGPMRGIPQFNFPAFFAAERMLEDAGHVVFNPASHAQNEHGRFWEPNATGDLGAIPSEAEFDLRKAMATYISWICREAEAIYILRGWEDSLGARAEIAAARAVGAAVIYASDGCMPETS